MSSPDPLVLTLHEVSELTRVSYTVLLERVRESTTTGPGGTVTAEFAPGFRAFKRSPRRWGVYRAELLRYLETVGQVSA